MLKLTCSHFDAVSAWAARTRQVKMHLVLDELLRGHSEVLVLRSIPWYFSELMHLLGSRTSMYARLGVITGKADYFTAIWNAIDFNEAERQFVNAVSLNASS
ncbi:hypothetical protein L226DRAFT_367385 [Lentinus tigrinus ALCF2SS1-7]|uniref:uncharacterized protein n=1 Tax=Lentinus tigrinus ALCF2SS1-7 TaxID=1328758 RepID=UPI00116617DB|nr:hypothetical protein L226DRAFT_367385 [Lentinus tigrinus ALCF2SS1-7]